MSVSMETVARFPEVTQVVIIVNGQPSYRRTREVIIKQANAPQEEVWSTQAIPAHETGTS